ncbi:MAG: cation diffusion facilitator family transporter [Magnetococcus sp. DMHC-6]
MRYSKCVICNELVGWIGLTVNLLLSIVLFFIGTLASSQALLAHGFYSIKEAAISIQLIIQRKVSQQPIDQEHPFGHGKAEFLISLVTNLFLILITCWLFYNSLSSLLEGDHLAPHAIAFWTALICLCTNLFLYFYTGCVGREVESDLVTTLSLNQKWQVSISAAVAFGIIGSRYLGILWLDLLVALGVCLHLIYLCGVVIWDSFHGLMDASAPRKLQREIRGQALKVEGVRSLEELQTRWVGQELWCTLVIGIDPDLSIRQGKEIATKVARAVIEVIPTHGEIGVSFKSQTGTVPEFDQITQEMIRLSEEQEGTLKSRP